MRQAIRKYRNLHPFTLMSIGIVVNFGIGATKLIYGYIFASYWLIITAMYYLIICVARGYLFYSFDKHKLYENTKDGKHKQYVSYHYSGYFLMLLSISYGISCVCMLYFKQEITYPTYILFGVVGFSFYKIGSAIAGFLSARKHQSLMLSAIKIIACLDACVSIVASQCAILTMQQSIVASSSSAYLGMACSILFLLIGIYMSMKKHVKNARNMDFQVMKVR